MKTFYQSLAAFAAVLGFTFVSAFSANAQSTVQSISSGEWSNQDNWDCGCVPSPEDDVVISATSELNLTENTTVKNLSIISGGTLTLSASSVIELTVTGDWDNQGNFGSESGKVIFSGTEDQAISGITDFYELELSGSQNVIVNGETGVFHALNIQGSNLQTNGMFTLKTQLGETASLLPLINGSITGDVKLEKEFHNTTAGWMQFGAPFVDATFGQLNDDVTTTGYPGSNFPNSSFVNLRYYSEPVAIDADSYLPVGTAADTIEAGLGYYLYSNAGTYTLDFEGEIITGEHDFPVTYTENGDTKRDGLNLVANPYPGSIDWTSESGWEKNNMAGALYLWNSEMKRFRTYLNGYAVNNGSPIIGAGDSFWVQASGENPSMTVNETAKTSETSTEVNTTEDFLKLKLSNGATRDEIIVVFDEEASMEYESDKDAFKFQNSSNPISISSVSSEDLTLCINSVPLTNESLSIPVLIRVNTAATYTLAIQDIPQNMADDRCLYMEDTVTGQIYDLTATGEFEFDSEVVENQGRFIIHLSEKVAPEVTNIACFGDNNGQINVDMISEGTYDYYLLDNNLNEIESVMQTTEPVVFEDLTPGTYTVEVHTDGGYCSVRTVQTQITQGAEISAHAIPTHIDCGEDLVGAIDLLPVGGTGPLTFQWSNEASTEDLENIAGGDYTVIMTDSLGCTREMTFNVFEAVDVVAEFEVPGEPIELIEGVAEFQFNNMTSGATQYEWDFDDGTFSEEENPVHNFTQTGTFLVELTAQNDDCADSFQAVINVEQGVNVEELNDNGLVEIKKDQSGWYLQIDFQQGRQLEINVYNLVGQKITSTIRGNFDNDRVSLGQLSQAQLKLIEVRDLENGDAKTFKVTN
ncbi:PKD domain-containing protein [Halocola ammonii]